MRWFRTEYIGTVTARTQYVNSDGSDREGGACIGRYILTVGWFGRRKVRLVGHPGGSARANDIKAKVMAWKSGGPLPELDDDTRVRPRSRVLQLVKA